VSGTLERRSEIALAATGDVGEVYAISAPIRLRTAIVENYEFIWRSLRRLGVAQSSAEDAAQQVLVVFARRFGDVRPGAERAFLFATAIRVAADYRKKQRRSREVPDSDGLDDHASLAPPADQLIDRGRARELLDRVLEEMPIDLRSVLILFEIENITMAVIAEMLELPPGTVASRIRRARAMFESIAEKLQHERQQPKQGSKPR
jgi:RNA polymerase sigma-70 factor (ECF subfamily)